jgi:hypothetical protein
MGFAESFESIGFVVGEAEFAEPDERLLVVVPCLGRTTGPEFGEAEAVQHPGCPRVVTVFAEDGEGLLAADACLAIVAEPRPVAGWRGG